MTELLDTGLLLLLLLGASLFGLLMQPLLAERYRSRETVELIQLVVTMLVTFAALVLGLLTTSVKASFDTISNDVRGYATDIIQLNRLLTEYGNGADQIQQELRSYTAAAIATTWVNEPRPTGINYPSFPSRLPTDATLESSGLGGMLANIELRIRMLPAPDQMHQRLVADTLNQLAALLQQRWKLIEEAHASISMPFYLVLVFWLVIVFASFGLSSPRNTLAGTVILLGALSIASAIFVILELDTPFVGLITISSQPMRDALAHLAL